MCGGGGDKPYDAYKSGDYNQWKHAFDKKAAIDVALAKGEISQQQADRQIAALSGGTSALAPAGGGRPTSTNNSLRDPRDAQTTTTTVSSGKSLRDPREVQVDNAAPSPVARGTPGFNFDAMANKLKQDPSAGMEMREVMRQHDIGLGRIGIDKAFGQFGDEYYDKYKGDFTGYYMPQLDEQFAKANDKGTASLADRGMLESTVGASTLADLAKKNADARTNISNEALDAANKLRGNVENSKSSLYSLNEASANPQAVNAQAVGQATALVAPPQYSPLGEVFASALNSFGSFQNARNNSPTKSYQSPYGGATGYGSGSVVR